MNRKKINFFRSLPDLLFPRICFVCSRRIAEGIICEDCQQKLVFLDDVCDFCGSSLKQGKCPKCVAENFRFDLARSVFPFDKTVQALIHNLKYDEMTKVAKFLSAYAVRYLQEKQPFDQVDFIVPVPLHTVKKRSRGFNQSELFTHEIAVAMNWQHLPNLIKRNRFTQTQTKLGRIARQKNVAGAFSLNPKVDITGKNILLFDDVFTTGSTLNAIATLLKENQASNVYAFTIA
nr:ComF family protein [Candidatus Cloacimonadota bacterium]